MMKLACNFKLTRSSSQIPLLMQMLRIPVLEQRSTCMCVYVYSSAMGGKALTTVQGLKEDISYNKILKDLKKEFCYKLAHVSAGGIMAGGRIVAGGRKILQSSSNLRTKRSRNSCMRERSW